MREYPPIVTKLVNFHDGWIVGSAAYRASPRDIDVLIPFSQWNKASLLIPPDAKPNTFGGWKFMDEGLEIDVWPGELSELLSLGKTDEVYHPKSARTYRFTRMDGV
jgi:hypothetical protein